VTFLKDEVGGRWITSGLSAARPALKRSCRIFAALAQAAPCA
jgi:hypothetical protein